MNLGFRVFELVFVCVVCWVLPFGFGSSNSSSRPAVVNIGAIFTFDSTIGRVAKLAIQEAVKDVNSNSSILHGTKLVVNMKSSNCSGFLGMVQGNHFFTQFSVGFSGFLDFDSQEFCFRNCFEIVRNLLLCC